MNKKLISLVIPVFNEEENISACYRQVMSAIECLKDRYEFEFIFTDNHSSDKTFEILRELAAVDRRIRVFRFSRNMGYQRSILTGYCKAKGQAAIQLDVDLQDPPEMIPYFLEKWEEGNEVVYGIRKSRKEGLIITQMRKAFYRLIDFLSEDTLPIDAGDFRLVGRKALDGLIQLDDHQPYLRGSISTLGFAQLGVPYDRQERKMGVSKFNWKDLFELAIDGVLNHSIIPLRLASYIGLIVSVLTFLGGICYFIARLTIGQQWQAGFTTIAIFILFSASLNAIFLGIIGEYLGRIYKQLKKQPLILIEHEINGAQEL